MNSARRNIFKRLNSSGKVCQDAIPDEKLQTEDLSLIEKIEKLKFLMEAIRTEVCIVESDWLAILTEILKEKGLKNLLYSPDTDMGKVLEEHWNKNRHGLPELIPYSEDIEEFKEELFEVDASITATKGGIADLGALILWPDEKEPRTMSLIPPVHIALLKKEKIFINLSEAIEREYWQEAMPTNALLISGPSKTADIELTLAYGVHGPKELILLIV